MGCKKTILEANRRYNKTEKAKEVRRRYRNSNKGKKWYEKYNKSTEKLLEIHKRLARKNNVEGSFTKKEWEKLLFEFHYICPCCLRDNVKLTVDHIVPLSKGGTNYIENIQPLCGRCNSEKGAKTIKYILIL